MKKISLLLLIFVVLFITACTEGPEELSSEALITALTAAGVIGEPVIDAVAKTVNLTVEPMDISGAVPTVTVSAGASVTSPAAIADGVGAVYTVTSEDGTEVEWTVTVNVAFGVSFTIDEVKTVLLSGCSNSGDSVSDENCGSGVPGIQRNGDSSAGWIHEIEYDWDDGGEPAGDYIHIDLDGNSVGEDTGILYFDAYPPGSGIEFNIDWIITEYGSELGDVFRSSFSGTELLPDRAGDSVLSSGYAKLKVILDYEWGVG